MNETPQNQKEFGYYMALAQIGTEMAAPIAVGWALDAYLDWKPWGVIGGALIGLVGGFTHLLALLKRQDQSNSPRPPVGPPSGSEETTR